MVVVCHSEVQEKCDGRCWAVEDFVLGTNVTKELGNVCPRGQQMMVIKMWEGT